MLRYSMLTLPSFRVTIKILVDELLVAGAQELDCEKCGGKKVMFENYG